MKKLFFVVSIVFAMLFVLSAHEVLAAPDCSNSSVENKHCPPPEDEGDVNDEDDGEGSDDLEPQTTPTPLVVNNKEVKEWLCHKTGSEKNPWTLIPPNSSSWKAHHSHGDKHTGYYGMKNKPDISVCFGQEPTETLTPTPTPTPTVTVDSGDGNGGPTPTLTTTVTVDPQWKCLTEETYFAVADSGYGFRDAVIIFANGEMLSLANQADIYAVGELDVTADGCAILVTGKEAVAEPTRDLYMIQFGMNWEIIATNLTESTTVDDRFPDVLMLEVGKVRWTQFTPDGGYVYEADLDFVNREIKNKIQLVEGYDSSSVEGLEFFLYGRSNDQVFSGTMSRNGLDITFSQFMYGQRVSLYPTGELSGFRVGESIEFYDHYHGLACKADLPGKELSFSPDGRLMFLVDENDQLVLLHTSGKCFETFGVYPDFPDNEYVSFSGPIVWTPQRLQVSKGVINPQFPVEVKTEGFIENPREDNQEYPTFIEGSSGEDALKGIQKELSGIKDSSKDIEIALFLIILGIAGILFTMLIFFLLALVLIFGKIIYSIVKGILSFIAIVLYAIANIIS